jgi:hypothetical protein
MASGSTNHAWVGGGLHFGSEYVNESMRLVLSLSRVMILIGCSRIHVTIHKKSNGVQHEN